MEILKFLLHFILEIFDVNIIDPESQYPIH